MNTNWTQVLVFTLLALILGFILGRVTGHKRSHRPDKEKCIIMMDGERGHHNSGEQLEWHENNSQEMEFSGGEALNDIVKSIEKNGFQGDTVFKLDGADVQLTRNGDEVRIEVKKEVREERIEKGKSIKIIEEEVEEH